LALNYAVTTGVTLYVIFNPDKYEKSIYVIKYFMISAKFNLCYYKLKVIVVFVLEFVAD